MLFLLITVANAQVTESLAEATRLSYESKKPILLVFAGSDWCQPCIRFDKNILQNDVFLNYAKESLIVLKCDFPQRRKLSKETIKQNEELAEKFNSKGEFPTLLLLDNNLNKIANLTYNSQTVEQFIKEIQQQNALKTGLKEYRKKEALMGSFFEFVLVAPEKDEEQIWALINTCIKEVYRIERLISEWIPNSEVSQLNQQAGKEPIEVGKELYQLLERSMAISKLTQGAFDLTFLAYYDYWNFNGNQPFPFDTAKIKALTPFVNYEKIQLLPDQKVFLPKGFKIGLGGIGQGYAVDKIKKMLLDNGYNDFVINSSGDVYAHGLRADGTPWKVGVASPLDRDKIVQWLPVKDFAVVTSGTSEKNFEYKGQIYSHIINPKTGFPVEGLQSVTVLSEFTEIADALATSILILGTEVGLNLINQLPKTHCIIIDSNQKIHYSNDLDIKN